jgi:hypothetical protein
VVGRGVCVIETVRGVRWRGRWLVGSIFLSVHSSLGWGRSK